MRMFRPVVSAMAPPRWLWAQCSEELHPQSSLTVPIVRVDCAYSRRYGRPPMQPAITAQSLDLFLAYARDAGNWSGTPLVGGNVGGTTEDRGNLTQLKRAGLIKTFRYEGETWVEFTAQGNELAAAHGVKLD